MTRDDAQAHAHRALATAYVLGAVPRVKPGMRVSVGEIGAIAEASAADSADLIVATDEGRVDDARMADSVAAVRKRVGDGVLALLVGSPVTQALVRHVRRTHAGEENAQAATVASGMAMRGDAWGRALRWASSRDASLAPAVEPQRLARFVEVAAAAGLTLVEPEMAMAAPRFAHVRGMRSPRARALFATVALGAGSRPMIFVPSVRAPKGGLARAKVERVADGWIGAAPAFSASEPSADGDLLGAARTVLEHAARARRGALHFKELLREARERWTTLARASGGRATTSAGDARELAASLHASAAAEEVMLYALDPTDPGWALTII